MTIEELLETVCRYYPKGLLCTREEYRASSEHGRLLAALKVARAELPRWKALLRSLGAKYSVSNESLHIEAGRLDSAYSGVIFLGGVPEYPLGFHVSILGPYYVVHRSGWPGEETAIEDIVHEIEAVYRGYQAIPPDLGDVVVPDVSVDSSLGKSTVYDCLLGNLGTYHKRPLPEEPTGKGPKNFKIWLTPGKPQKES